MRDPLREQLARRVLELLEPDVEIADVVRVELAAVAQRALHVVDVGDAEIPRLVELVDLGRADLQRRQGRGGLAGDARILHVDLDLLARQPAVVVEIPLGEIGPDRGEEFLRDRRQRDVRRLLGRGRSGGRDAGRLDDRLPHRGRPRPACWASASEGKSAEPIARANKAHPASRRIRLGRAVMAGVLSGRRGIWPASPVSGGGRVPVQTGRRRWIRLMLLGNSGAATSSWPGLSRLSTSFFVSFVSPEAWMPGTSEL